MPYRITHVKACQGHDQTLIDKVGTAPLVKQIISFDYDFSAEDLGRGLYPRVPIYPHLAEVEVPEEFRTVYHYTSWSSLQQTDYLHWHFPRSLFLQGARVHDTSCALGNRRQGSWCQDESSIVLGNRHRLRIALWHSPGGNLGRSNHHRRLGPQPLSHLRFRLRKVPIPLGQPWLQRGQENIFE